jgi:hypothetical protein
MDPGCLPRIRIFPIPNPGSASKNFSILNPKKLLLSSRKYDPGFSIRYEQPGSYSWDFSNIFLGLKYFKFLSRSRMRILIFYRIQGSKRHRIPDPYPRHWVTSFSATAVGLYLNNAGKQRGTAGGVASKEEENLQASGSRGTVNQTFPPRWIFNLCALALHL